MDKQEIIDLGYTEIKNPIFEKMGYDAPAKAFIGQGIEFFYVANTGLLEIIKSPRPYGDLGELLFKGTVKDSEHLKSELEKAKKYGKG